MSEAGSGGRKLLIGGTHSGDFVSRAAGAIAAASRGRKVCGRARRARDRGRRAGRALRRGLVMDGDGAVVVSAGRAEEVLEAGRRREADEPTMMDELRAGALTLELMGLRDKPGAEGG